MYKKIAFIHVPRTGGTFLSEYKHDKWLYAGHITIQDFISKYGTEYYTIANIRNPWDWYVSRYFYFCRSKYQERGFSKYNDAGLTDIAFKEKFSTFEEHIRWGVKNANNNFWLSNLYNCILCDKNKILIVNEIVCFENFIEHITKIFEKLNISNSNLLQHNAPKNQTNHEHYSKYYSKKTRDLIFNIDKNIIKRYNYEF